VESVIRVKVLTVRDCFYGPYRSQIKIANRINVGVLDICDCGILPQLLKMVLNALVSYPLMDKPTIFTEYVQNHEKISIAFQYYIY